MTHQNMLKMELRNVYNSHQPLLFRNYISESSILILFCCPLFQREYGIISHKYCSYCYRRSDNTQIQDWYKLATLYTVLHCIKLILVVGFVACMSFYNFIGCLVILFLRQYLQYSDCHCNFFLFEHNHTPSGKKMVTGVYVVTAS